MSRTWPRWGLLCVLLASASHASQPAQVVTRTELKAKPDAKAETVSVLASGSAVSVATRQGGWYAAETPQGKGWIRLLHVRLAGSASAPGQSNVDALLRLGSASRTDTTVATGIRGLTEAELQQARENPQELRKLDAYAVTEAEARAFASRGDVVATNKRKE